MKKVIGLVMVVMAVFFCGSALAADFEKEFAKALTNIPPDASNASMGNAWAATPLFGSNSAAVTAMGTFKNGGASFNYGFIGFDKGPDVQFWSPSVAMKLPVGVLQVSYTAGSSDRGTFYEEFSEEGVYSEDIEFDSVEEIDLQYGLLAGEKIFLSEDKLYLGIGYNHARGYLEFGQRFLAEDFSLSGLLESKTKSHSWSASAVYQPNSKLSLGVFYAHSWDKGKDKAYFDGELIETDSYREQSNQYRFGVGVQVIPSTFVAVDFQHLDLPSGNSDQIFAGVEQAVVGDWLYVYAGWAGDGPTGGVGAYFENGGINLAYMHDTNDGLDDTLGKTDLWMVAGYWNF